MNCKDIETSEPIKLTKSVSEQQGYSYNSANILSQTHPPPKTENTVAIVHQSEVKITAYITNINNQSCLLSTLEFRSIQKLTQKYKARGGEHNVTECVRLLLAARADANEVYAEGRCGILHLALRACYFQGDDDESARKISTRPTHRETVGTQTFAAILFRKR